jgi:hypothetical protein
MVILDLIDASFVASPLRWSGVAMGDETSPAPHRHVVSP